MLTPRSFSNSSDTNHQQAAKSQNSPTSENPDLPADSVDDLPF